MVGKWDQQDGMAKIVGGKKQDRKKEEGRELSL